MLLCDMRVISASKNYQEFHLFVWENHVLVNVLL